MAANVYEIGSLVRLTCTFTAAGVAADPGTVTVHLRAPDGTVTTPAAVKDSTGVYHVDVNVTDDGDWRYRFIGTTPAQASVSGIFVAREDEVG
jgi:hypothetical protein